MRNTTPYALGFLVFLHLALMIFLDQPLPTEAEASWLYSFINVASWTTFTSTQFWIGLLLTVGATLVATMVWMKTEFPIYATIAVTGFLSSIGPYFSLYQHLNSFAQGATGAGLGATVPIMVPFFVPILLAWTFIILEFARGRDV